MGSGLAGLAICPGRYGISWRLTFGGAAGLLSCAAVDMKGLSKVSCRNYHWFVYFAGGSGQSPPHDGFALWWGWGRLGASTIKMWRRERLPKN